MSSRSEEVGQSKVSMLSQDIQRFKSAAALNTPIVLALLIISALTLAGKMTGIVAGGSIVGLSSAVILIQVVTACRTKTPSMKKAPLCVALIPLVTVILGSMALTGTLPLSAAAWTVCGSAAGAAGITLLVSCCLGISQGIQSKKMASQNQGFPGHSASGYNPYNTDDEWAYSDNRDDYEWDTGYSATPGYSTTPLQPIFTPNPRVSGSWQPSGTHPQGYSHNYGRPNPSAPPWIGDGAYFEEVS